MDKKDILKELGDIPEDVYDQIVKGFYDETRGRLKNISEAIGNANWTGIATLAHGIKGSAANLRLIQIQEIAKCLEDAAKSADRAAANEFFELLKKLL